MDCGIPYCHNGCPVNNQIPDWNDLVYSGRLARGAAQPALDQQLPGVHRPRLPGALRGVLHAQPRGRAGHHQDDRMRHRRPRLAGGLDRAGAGRRRGPASASRSSARGRPGLAAAQQLARVGHEVHVFEKNGRAGGLLRYGIPDFKMEKHHVDRRVRADGGGGRHLPLRRPCRRDDAGRASSSREFDAVLLAGGAEKPRDLPIEGRDLDGIHFAMDFLPQQNRRVSRREHRRRRPDPRRPASTSSSSAAATPAPTASAPRSARARCRSRSSRSCRSRPCARTSR